MSKKFSTRQLLLSLAILAIVLAVLLLTRPDLVLFREDRTWSAMHARGTWRVGMDPSFPPFESLDATGKPVGFDVDLAQRMAADWDLTLEIVPIGFDSLLDAVQTGRIDSIVSALPFDPRLTKDVAYSQPYFEAGLRLVVRTDSPLAHLAIENAADFAPHLSGQRIAVEWGGQGDGVGRRLQRADPTVELIAFETPQEAAAALVTDPTIDALFVDNITLLQQQGRGAPITAVGPALEGNPYVIAAPLSAYELQAAIDQTLDELIRQGTLRALEEKWLSTSTPDTYAAIYSWCIPNGTAREKFEASFTDRSYYVRWTQLVEVHQVGSGRRALRGVRPVASAGNGALSGLAPFDARSHRLPLGFLDSINNQL